MTWPAPDTTTDQTLDIINAIATLDPNADNVIPAGTYRTDYTVTSALDGLRLRGPAKPSQHAVPGARFLRVVEPTTAPPWFVSPDGKPWNVRGNAHWRHTGDGGVFADFTIEGANTGWVFSTATEAQNGLVISGTDGWLGHGMRFTHTRGDGLFAGALAQVWATNWELRDSDIAEVGRQGISPVSSREFYVHDNVVFRVRRSFVDLEPAGETQGALRGRVMRNELDQVQNALVACGSALGDVGYILIQDNHTTGPLRIAFANDNPDPNHNRRHHIAAVGNVGDGTAASGNIKNVDRLVFLDNTYPLQAGREGLQNLDTCTQRDVELVQPWGPVAYHDADYVFDPLDYWPREIIDPPPPPPPTGTPPKTRRRRRVV